MRYEEDMSTCLTDSLHAQQQPAAPIPSAGPTVKKHKDLQAQTEKAERQRRIDSSNLGKRTEQLQAENEDLQEQVNPRCNFGSVKTQENQGDTVPGETPASTHTGDRGTSVRVQDNLQQRRTGPAVFAPLTVAKRGRSQAEISTDGSKRARLLQHASQRYRASQNN
eukprot:257811-Prorocentrum_minimum.AAC.1